MYYDKAFSYREEQDVKEIGCSQLVHYCIRSIPFDNSIKRRRRVYIALGLDFCGGRLVMQHVEVWLAVE